MPAAAIVGAAAIGAVGSAVASSKNSKAINTATDAQTQTARENNALTGEIYEANKGILAPFVNSGTMATGNINALLGLGGANDNGTAQAAFDAFRSSTGYSFRQAEGQKGLNASFAARGLGNSGASAKAALTFGQNIASDEFGRYLGQLGQQQQIGLGAGSALAGVGQNFAGSVSANNNNAASAIGNGALAGAANTNALYGNLAGIAGQTAGYLSSYQNAGLMPNQRNPYGVAGGPIY